MIKLSDELHIPTMREILATPSRPKHKRSYAAAKLLRTNRDWAISSEAINPILTRDLRILRVRAREMARNSSHFRKFLIMAKSNIIGASGIRLQCRAEFGSGRPNTKLNNRVENAFWEWGHPETCSASSKLSWIDAQNLFVEMLIRDGEVLIEHVKSYKNPFGYCLKFWNADWLDETQNETAPNGNRIIMGVEVDKNDRPVAYHLTEPPQNYLLGVEKSSRKRRRVAASEMIHAFLVFEDESQARGVTWFHAALLQAKDLHEYTTGVVQQARVAAHTLGFLERPPGDDIEFTGAEDDNGNIRDIEIDVAPLSMNELPPGYSLRQFDPKQPAQNHAEFKRSMLLDIAAALGVNGFSLSGDMGDVNYSSARVGLGEERDIWRSLQSFVAQKFCRPVFHRWLQEAMLSGALELSTREYEQVRNPQWRPRGWRYVDPQKEIAANINALNNNLSNYTDILADQGVDLEEWLASKAAEKLLFEKYGIEYNPQAKQSRSEEPAPPEDSLPAEDTTTERSQDDESQYSLILN